MRHGTLEDHVAGIVEKPALVHASQFVAHHIVGGINKYFGVFIIAHGIRVVFILANINKNHQIFM